MGEIPKSTDTRESDLDKEMTYSLFDEFMQRVDDGQLTLTEAIESYTALMKIGAEGLHGASQ